MRKWKKQFSAFRLQLFDSKADFFENKIFSKNLFTNSKKGFILSVLLFITLFSADFLARRVVSFLDTFSNSSLACQIVEGIYTVNQKIGLKNIDYFADVVSISAGVLGVILGLFYTAFMTIIATKYSNINSIISFQMLENKAINKYFITLATLTSLAILFQLSLSFGYSPTLISCILFSLLVVAALASFIQYGKFSLIYFDTSHLVVDLINENHRVLYKIVKEKDHISNLERGRFLMYKIYRNIEKIQLIIKESNNSQTSNTSLDTISKRLLDFSIYYNSVKHTIPSKKGWHLQKNKYKGWEEAKEWDFNLLKTTGTYIQPEKVDTHNLIEKKIVDAQFELFYQHINDSGEVELLFDQHRYNQVTAVQCDFETFEYFFTRLQKFILEKLKSASIDNQVFRLQLISLYPTLLIHHLVGFNHNLSIFDNNHLSKLAKAIHFGQNTNNILQFPYFIRKWIDGHQEKLNIEFRISEERITPLFYTEFELAQTIQYELQRYWKKLVSYCKESIQQFSEALVHDENKIEALYLNMSSIELCKKIGFFSESTSEKISSLNEFNFQQHNSPFIFSKKEELLNENIGLNNILLINIWELGISVYKINKKELPDIYGSFYHLILDDIIDKILDKDLDERVILKYLPKYLSHCRLYLEYLRGKYKDSENVEFFALKLSPVIIDMYEVSALVILIGKIHGQEEIINIIFDYWNQRHQDNDEEISFWEPINVIHTYFKKSIYGLSTPSHIKEYNRLQRFEKYLIENDFVRKEFVKRGMSTIRVEKYVTDISDVYVQAFVHSMSVDLMSFIDLDEIFVEFFLRTRISLKDLNIEETSYGGRLRRLMGQ